MPSNLEEIWKRPEIPKPLKEEVVRQAHRIEQLEESLEKLREHLNNIQTLLEM